MAENEIHLNDVGTIIEVTITEDGSAVDVSTSTTQELILKDPKGNLKTKTTNFTTNGSDGKIQFTSVITDFDRQGVWRIQAHLVLLSPIGDWRSDFGDFTVFPNL